MPCPTALQDLDASKLECGTKHNQGFSCAVPAPDVLCTLTPQISSLKLASGLTGPDECQLTHFPNCPKKRNISSSPCPSTGTPPHCIRPASQSNKGGWHLLPLADLTLVLPYHPLSPCTVLRWIKLFFFPPNLPSKMSHCSTLGEHYFFPLSPADPRELHTIKVWFLKQFFEISNNFQKVRGDITDAFSHYWIHFNLWSLHRQNYWITALTPAFYSVCLSPS